MAGQGPIPNAGSTTGQAQMRREWDDEPSEFPSQGQATIYNQGQGTFLHETGSQIKNMTHGAADVGKGATQGVVSMARGAATGAASIVGGAAGAVKNTFGMNSPSQGQGQNPSLSGNASMKNSNNAFSNASMRNSNNSIDYDMEGLTYPSNTDSSNSPPNNTNHPNNPNNPSN